MRENVLIWTAVVCLIVAGKSEGLVTPQSWPRPVAELEEDGEIEVSYASEKYTCEDWEAGDPLYKAAKALENSNTVDWVDILPYIRPYHLAQGFVDILLTVDMHKMEVVHDTYTTSVDLPDWYMLGDADDGRDNDIRAYCDGAFYDLIDKDFKTTTSDIFNPDAKINEYVILRFGVPPEVKSYYKIFIGKRSIALRSGYGSGYTDSCQVKLYLEAPGNLYAYPQLVDVPVSYEGGKLIRQVFLNTPVTFDGTGSIDLSGTGIIEYAWTFDYEQNPEPDPADIGPDAVVTHTYATGGLKKVVLSVTNLADEISSSNGDCRVSVSCSPLPLWVKVIKPPEEEKNKLYPCAPHPFMPAEHGKTKIKYLVLSPEKVSIKVYTLSGDLVKTLVDEEKPTGEWVTKWDGTNEDGEEVASGIYFCQLEAGGTKSIKRIVVIR